MQTVGTTPTVSFCKIYTVNAPLYQPDGNYRI